MTETREEPRDFGDGFKGYVLNRGQMTLYTSVRFPHDGFYTFPVRARSGGPPCGGRLRIDGEPKGDIVASSRTPEILTVTRFVKAGSRQMTWNIETQDPAGAPAGGGPRAGSGERKGAGPQQKQQRRPQQQNQGRPRSAKPLPDNVEELITTRAQENATDYPPTGKEPMGAEPLIMRLNSFAVNVQRPYEWIRVLLAYDGEKEETRAVQGLHDRTRGASRPPQGATRQDARRAPRRVRSPLRGEQPPDPCRESQAARLHRAASRPPRDTRPGSRSNWPSSRASRVSTTTTGKGRSERSPSTGSNSSDRSIPREPTSLPACSQPGRNRPPASRAGKRPGRSSPSSCRVLSAVR